MLTQAATMERLEELLDQSDLASLILALARVCNEKAEHLRCNWQDEITAKVWDRAARKLDKFSTDSSIEALS